MPPCGAVSLSNYSVPRALQTVAVQLAAICTNLQDVCAASQGPFKTLQCNLHQSVQTNRTYVQRPRALQTVAVQLASICANQQDVCPASKGLSKRCSAACSNLCQPTGRADCETRTRGHTTDYREHTTNNKFKRYTWSLTPPRSSCIGCTHGICCHTADPANQHVCPSAAPNTPHTGMHAREGGAPPRRLCAWCG